VPFDEVGIHIVFKNNKGHIAKYALFMNMTI
jgi:hypothetical protein